MTVNELIATLEYLEEYQKEAQVFVGQHPIAFMEVIERITPGEAADTVKVRLIASTSE